MLRINLTLGLASLVAGCVLAASNVHAVQLAIVLSDDSAPYQEIYEAIKARADDHDITVSRLYAGAATEAELNAKLIVVAGVRAAESVANIAGQTPVLAVLVPRDWYRKTGRQRLAGNEHRPVSAIYLDQPYERQAQLIHVAFPDVKRVGVLVSAAQGVPEDIGAALRAQGLTLVAEVLEPGQQLIEPLEKVFSMSDLMLAVPDPEVFNRNTAQSVLLTSYRYRDPVVGYSRSLARAGALLALYSSPAEIGRQAAEWIQRKLEVPASHLPDPAYPRYFSVSINQQVARSLGFALVPEAELERRLEGKNND
ncbi:MAG: ABC transporter substrate binding protein [Thiobacillaceae bacterium]